ncbi:hypothetical protein [Thermus sp. LT1-2-5]|uniref:hypothetical protein n=1 Tax=Thermus sp. LT1-2-5 TaxID=3026935 RepID=UPI00336543DF
MKAGVFPEDLRLGLGEGDLRHPGGGAYREVKASGPGKRLSFLGVAIPTEDL